MTDTRFDARKDVPVIRAASLAFVEALLADIMPHLTLTARGCGYAVAVHGSRCRDVDVIAVPWTEDADNAEFLVQRLLGTLSGLFGRAVVAGEVNADTWTEKPHGRKALTIILPGMCPEIDLSIMPLSSQKDAAK